MPGESCSGEPGLVGGGSDRVTVGRSGSCNRAASAVHAVGRPVDDAHWGDHATTADQHAAPQVFFTDLEAAAVGLTAEQAASAGHRIKTIDLDLNAAQGANLYADNYQGHARMVVDLDPDVLLGVTFVGSGVSELPHSATVAVAGEVPLPAGALGCGRDLA